MSETVARIPRNGPTEFMKDFIGENGEATVDSTKRVWVIHDGSTPGGHAQAREDLANVSKNSIVNKNILLDDFSNAKYDELNKRYAKVDASNLDFSKIYEEGVAKSDASNIRHATQHNMGVCRFCTTDEAIAGISSDSAVSPYTLKMSIVSATRVFNPMFISGLHLKYNDGNSVTMQEGYCRSENDAVNFHIDVPVIVTLPATQANTTYHVFLGQNSEGHTIARMFSELVPSELINSGYQNYRRVGSVITDDSGSIVPFTVIGDFYKYNTPIECTTEKLPVPSDIDLEIQTSTVYFHANTNRSDTNTISVQGYCDRRQTN